jgi:hypothetical protein
MDEVERLTGRLTAMEPIPATEMISILVQLDRFRDPRVVPLVLRLVVDETMRKAVRIHALRMLRNGRLTSDERGDVAETLCTLLSGAFDSDVRLEAALALGEFTDMPNVLTALGSIALAHERVDLRYAAFMSVERGEPTSELIDLLRNLSSDETLGPSARRVLSAWNRT